MVHTLFLAIITLLLLLTGCQHTPEQPRILKEAMLSLIDEREPNISQSIYAREIFQQVFETLFSYDSSYRLNSRLVKHFEYSDDFKKLTLHLHQEIHFSDGTPLDANFVRFRLIEKKPLYTTPFYEHLHQIIVTSPTKVEFYFDRPQRNVVEELASPFYTMSKCPATGPCLGTGPYKIGTTSDDFVALVKNTHFRDTLVFDRIEFYRVDKLTKNNIRDYDLFNLAPLPTEPWFLEYTRQNYAPYYFPTLRTGIVLFNIPNIQLRHAVRNCIDWQMLRNIVIPSESSINANSFLPEGISGRPKQFNLFSHKNETVCQRDFRSQPVTYHNIFVDPEIKAKIKNFFQRYKDHFTIQIKTKKPELILKDFLNKKYQIGFLRIEPDIPQPYSFYRYMHQKASDCFFSIFVPKIEESIEQLITDVESNLHTRVLSLETKLRNNDYYLPIYYERKLYYFPKSFSGIEHSKQFNGIFYLAGLKVK